MEERISRIESVVDRMGRDVGYIRESGAVVRDFVVEMRKQDLPSRVATMEAFKKPLMFLVGALGALITGLAMWIRGA